MVDTGDQLLATLQLILHAQLLQKMLGADLDTVAQAYGFDAGVALHVACQHCHGVGVVKKPCIGADLFHIVRKALHHRDGTQCAHNAADAQGVGDGLAQAILFRHFKVGYGAGLIETHLNGVYHIVSASQGVLAVFHAAVGFDGGLVAKVVVQGLEHQFGFGKALGIDVVEGDYAVFQAGSEHAVAQHVLGKHGGAGAHKGNFRHNENPPSANGKSFLLL